MDMHEKILDSKQMSIMFKVGINQMKNGKCLSPWKARSFFLLSLKYKLPSLRYISIFILVFTDTSENNYIWKEV